MADTNKTKQPPWQERYRPFVPISAEPDELRHVADEVIAGVHVALVD